MMRLRTSLAVTLLTATLLACGTPPATGDGGMDASADAPVVDAANPDAPPPGPDDPVVARARRWEYVPTEGALCMNGTPTGFGVNLVPESDKLLIFFMGGGACFNEATCAGAFHPGGFGANAFLAETSIIGQVGPMSRTTADNPFRDWNYVYIGYCTGDVHAGANTTGVDIGTKHYVFTGYANVQKYLRRMVPTFRNVRHVLVTGVSAGGFGAAWNYDQIATAFGPTVDVSLADDSGPPLSDTYLAPCLQQRWRDLWNLDATVPQDCADCRNQPGGGGIGNMMEYLARKYPTRRLGLVSATEDGTIRDFFSYGRGTPCGVNKGRYPGADFRAALLEVRTRTMGTSFHSYLVNSDSHTWLFFPAWNETAVGGIPLVQWMDAVANGGAAFRDVGPGDP